MKKTRGSKPKKFAAARSSKSKAGSSRSRVSNPRRGAATKPPAKASAKSRRIPAKVVARKSAASSKPVAKPEPIRATKLPVNGAAKHINGAPKPPVVATPPRPPAVVLPKPIPRPDPVIPPEKDLSAKNKNSPAKDRIVLMVPDPHWLHAVWELAFQSVLRAESALGQDWHGAKPILRLFDVTSSDTTSTSEAPIRDIPIHGGCSHWYIDIPQPPRSYRVDVGYLSRRGQFYVLARSNVVTPPKAGASEPVEEGWAADLDKIGGAERVLAMSTGFETASGPSQLKEFFDEQFKRPAKEGAFGTGALPGKLKKFHFHIDAELLVFGRTDPAATVTLQNEKVPIRPDGTFSMRYSLPDSRQIIPAVATSADGLEEQTIVLAVERNIKRLDPMTHDMYGES
jgi:hypothetical protein